MRYFLIAVMAVIVGLSACNPGAGPDSTTTSQNAVEQSLLGTWTSNEPITIANSADSTVTMTESSIIFRSDGTLTRKMRVSVTNPFVVGNPMKMDMESDATWSATRKTLKDTLTSVTVTPLNYKEELASEIKPMEDDILSEPDSVTQIKSITDTEIILYEPADDITWRLEKAAPANPRILPSSDGDDSQ